MIRNASDIEHSGYRVTVKNLAGDTMVLETDPNDTVLHLKQFIAKEKHIEPYRVKLLLQIGKGHIELSNNQVINTDLDFDIFINDQREPPLFTPDVIQQHLDDQPAMGIGRPGLSHYLCLNPGITPQFIIDNIDNQEVLDWHALSSNPGIPLDFIKSTLGTPGYLWVFSAGGGGLSANPNITPEFLVNNIGEDWNWGALSSNPGMTLEFIEETIGTYNWHFFSHVGWANKGGLSGNPNITPGFVRSHLNNQWDWVTLSKNPNMI